MLTGGIKRKEQKFNAKSAGVTSTLLIVSLIGVFTPTLFQKFYGSYNVECESCPDTLKSQIDNGLTDVNTLLSNCTNCHFKQPDPVEDPFYQSHTKKLVWICAVALLLTYAVGLLFTLLTHVKQIYEKTKKNKKERRRSRSRTRQSHSKTNSLSENQSASTSSAKPDDDIIYNANGEVVNTILNVQTEEPKKDTASIASYNSDSDSEEEEVGHEPPSWTKLESVIVLLVSTVVFSLLAEILIGTVDVVLKNFNLDEKFLGVTLFAMAPNVSEFYNAIAFAMYGNIALSLEIGSAYATQVTMLQIPTLVLICAARAIFFDFPNESKYLFTLIFSRWDLFTIIIGVFLLSHVYTEGKSNYFKGAMLLMSYTVFVISYYFIA
jgi:Ca2+:H+ antiporter